jgi:hypothetical protein
MSTFAGNARTNDFRVKSIDLLRTDLAKVGITAGDPDTFGFGAEFAIRENNNGTIHLLSSGVWPRFDEDAIAERLELEDDKPLPSNYESLAHLVAAHLVDDEIAVFIEIGQEGFRYLAGSATAINSRSELRTIDLEDIYTLAKDIAPAGKRIDVIG